MTALETILSNAISYLSTDDFEFIYNLPSEQNMSSDEINYPAIFLDPYSSDDKITQSLYIEPTLTVNLFIGYKTTIDDVSDWVSEKTKAWNAARELVLRLLSDNDNVKTITGMKRTDVKNYSRYDINLSGCLLEFKIVLIDNSSNCLS